MTPEEQIAKEAAEEIVENQWKWAAGKSHTERMQVIILSAITKAAPGIGAEAMREALPTLAMMKGGGDCKEYEHERQVGWDDACDAAWDTVSRLATEAEKAERTPP